MAARIGFLPFYLALYDEVAKQNREVIEPFYQKIAQELSSKGIIVETSPICRVQKEFEDAIKMFNSKGVDALVSLHLAYSPSLESLPALLNTDLPLVILNTTPEPQFGFRQNPQQITFNHGIHGVQDMCSMLVRHKRPFMIESGHWQDSDVIDRVVEILRGISAAKNFRNTTVGVIGDPFTGMGDFFITPAQMKADFDIDVIPVPEIASSPDIEDINDELIYLDSLFSFDSVSEEVLRENVLITKKLKDWTADKGITAFTCNFREVTDSSPVNRVPFLFAGVGMYEGIGYAGEGDILTASLAHALLSINKETTFTEMFCPDWKDNRIFLSHMGEINPRICKEKATLAAKPYTYSSGLQPLYITGECRKGEVLLLNLIPMLNRSYRLLVCPMRMEESDTTTFEKNVRGWIKPKIRIDEFLTKYSLFGGTHHSVLCYDESITSMKTFGEQMGWEVIIIE
ncbi:hypothetical protein EXM22_14730 [Oceanispirochaeta crateris]|uniref:L-arabinose isomerase C-terminal domain-containing protein n=1 Tax=Oceanispirochaeta crateris TaxID=2518645 RepID=A0A5C1QM81_9SPIO|nr:hypothetical protein [Oceanispirochaeta crateris]QEN09173.1 hypothetical protein EXM22_14730 [Oceanispirochaeta crateris]